LFCFVLLCFALLCLFLSTVKQFDIHGAMRHITTSRENIILLNDMMIIIWNLINFILSIHFQRNKIHIIVLCSKYFIGRILLSVANRIASYKIFDYSLWRYSSAHAKIMLEYFRSHLSNKAGYLRYSLDLELFDVSLFDNAKDRTKNCI